MTKGLVIITTIRHSYVRRYAVCHMAKQKPVAHKLHSYLLMWVIILLLNHTILGIVIKIDNYKLHAVNIGLYNNLN